MFGRIVCFAGAFVLVLACSFAFKTLAGVTLEDLAAQMDMNLGLAQGSGGVSAGDIYWVSADGTRRDRLCSMALHETYVERRPVDMTFTNEIGASIPLVGSMFDYVDLAADGDHRGNLRIGGFVVRMRFQAEQTELEEGAPQGAPDYCEESMVRRAARGDLICIVKFSLIPEYNKFFTAYRFNSNQILIPGETFRKYGLEATRRTDVIGQKDCPRESARSWDVALRESLSILSVEVSEVEKVAATVR
ncbi:hypothetical protein [Mangrovicoccus sp. HB161399]|uniref:hypothetical protein n=1 Tax=Mangrovicoccus sp. HB161399 TaxID=2720392 RepID=UPI001556531B|nr:hypothetical protein [Mangrovicoccus sp. HB161399]